MAVGAPLLPIPDDDEAIRAALEDAHLPALLAALAQATGDVSILTSDLRPATGFGVAEPYTPEQSAAAKALAFDRLRRLRDEGAAPRAPTEAELEAMLAHMTADAVTDDYLPLMVEELDALGGDGRAPRWRKDELAPERAFSVAIVGAGMSGLMAAYRLKQAGVPFVILEKNDEVGGTWYENRYPGCRVDVANYFYSYSFVPKNDWPHVFSTQDHLLQYFKDCADWFGVRDAIRFRTEVVSMAWEEAAGVWRIHVRNAGGSDEMLEAQAVVSAVGQLNQPSFPDIPGRDTFEGPAFHSARWEQAVDLTGKRVAVIGTGCSAAQFVPPVAEQAAELTVFQRTPNWMLPTEGYHDEIAPGLRWLLERVPYYDHWYRFNVFWAMAEGMLPMVGVDEGWEDTSLTTGAGNTELRAMLTEHITSSLPDDPELAAKLIPQYPPGSKRIICDNGSWIAALKRPNVTLHVDGIREIDATGIVDGNGVHHDFDVIVYGTGFQPSKFLTPMKVSGRDGLDLHEHWAGDARAYLGITIPGFPNFFCMYGPNTNIVVNGSITWFSECEARYLVDCIRLLLAEGYGSLEPRKDLHDAFNERVDAGNRRMAWGVATVNTWYQNETGRVAQNWPFSLLEYWQETRAANPADFEWR